MIIVKLTGGLGNQMFQYAFYKAIKRRVADVYIDCTTFEKVLAHEHVNLKKIFKNIQFDEARLTDIFTLADTSRSYFSRIRRRCFGKRKTHIYEDRLTFKPELIGLTVDRYLDGYWQSELYFKDIKEEIIQTFSFPPLQNEKNIQLQDSMIDQNSVAIHVRKGKDYDSAMRRNICDVEYYKNAVAMIKQKVDSPVFYVFSDNIDWCKKNLDFIDLNFVDWNPKTGDDNYIDMQLMSYCKHNIIANSSFSWWGAWLNANKDKTVVAPKTWLNQDNVKHSISDIVPHSWILV
ncbi:alpha-1,2-fucosyltransferase [Mucilaginibacter myungsuensis]|uniref:Alpha-1,2-fucosyltransferase n=1 Tax=Mucilaginibacter myungsuensis TaxID=649104 RepID=A0A929KVL1_9SPHI|nr:alpha-1,2-fucosyltransferase [Mucilaginibacter myungsuensis]MBE9662411.1 alpha-1,2-fucosyltransferase [Mucilaginibacter myungsuensis]MDN3599152.1 alpha-1,2-fucosyltransferase [Mucilaginibacter myungsuensis]